MKRKCLCCNKKFVLSKRNRKEGIKLGWIPQDTNNYCDYCIKDIAGILSDEIEEFLAQSDGL